MKTIKRIGIYVAIYLFMSLGAVMAVQHSLWYTFPSVITITIGIVLVEYYAKNWEKFNE